MTGLGLYAWWDEPEYQAVMETFTRRGNFILKKLNEHDPIRLKGVMTDLYRDEPPDPMDITTFEWQTILAYLGATEEEIADVQKRMGRVWRCTSRVKFELLS